MFGIWYVLFTFGAILAVCGAVCAVWAPLVGISILVRDAFQSPRNIANSSNHSIHRQAGHPA